ncbi:sensor histidine kinase [bacterium D16-51]|nr:sensor histidine kinase [bacterium D16-59]RKI61320.1 sensor histidine kinase [bacterium D16-51]
MKNKRNANPFYRIFVVVSVLALLAAAICIGVFYYIFSIPEPEGLSLASWPERFTDNFSCWLQYKDGELKVEEIGIERLDEYGLWLQVVDGKGKEVYSHNKPTCCPAGYSASELMLLSTKGYENGNTIFVNSFESGGKSFGYLVGFPYAIGRHIIYYNGRSVERLLPVFRMGILSFLCAAAIFIVIYGFWITWHVGKITKGIGDISFRSYTSLPEKGVFRQVYAALNRMDTEIQHSDKLQRDTERARREWIANITHDVKTPLSPIKGYAELLSGHPVPDGKTVQEYGGIILKNANYTEKLINDLKITYQLESGVMPYHPQKVGVVRLLKELVIDIVNDPAFSSRDIEFGSNIEEAEVCLDSGLFRRAIGNLVVNALTHNPPETKVDIFVNTEQEGRLCVFIRDNGVGISGAEQSELWSRYYRGTNMKEKPEGSGLGLAIAKDIVMLHGGDIIVESRLGEGTEFMVWFPVKD